MKLPCPDPEGCKHFKESEKLQDENKKLKRKIARIRRLQKGYEARINSLTTLKYPARDIKEALKL
jgi:cell fate (sporulation/competence/biofilm development) regulator YmcA (YheA/YmcA/DUF963 family)